ncbi:MAG: hypothetical protein MZV49_24445 [Rhodopseudomonas palustris]|nr:hypothetical protein [Rhodopseudomonas palustris]
MRALDNNGCVPEFAIAEPGRQGRLGDHLAEDLAAWQLVALDDEADEVGGEYRRLPGRHRRRRTAGWRTRSTVGEHGGRRDAEHAGRAPGRRRPRPPGRASGGADGRGLRGAARGPVPFADRVRPADREAPPARPDRGVRGLAACGWGLPRRLHPAPRSARGAGRPGRHRRA